MPAGQRSQGCAALQGGGQVLVWGWLDRLSWVMVKSSDLILWVVWRPLWALGWARTWLTGFRFQEILSGTDAEVGEALGIQGLEVRAGMGAMSANGEEST